MSTFGNVSAIRENKFYSIVIYKPNNRGAGKLETKWKTLLTSSFAI